MCEKGWNFCFGVSLLQLLRENLGLPDARLAMNLKAKMAYLRARGMEAPYKDDEIDKMDMEAVRAALNMYDQ